ncbi:glycerate kinase [Mucilaginibacter sp. OK098]|uniref:glycerate kinase n=1 Tax=Mucilaginibacter sp. OK098 TaxID=1855297 RepID=UPI00091897E2|nr:glycerate kinase [Mucilaginibacter sp. OK098]SHN11800.1 glycerate kinase [Mucilaginibacter sp. OK098]
MHILIAPNAFKNSIDAAQVALAIQQGLTFSKLECTTACFPIADGGDGTGSLIIKSSNGVVINKEVSDPLGRKISSLFGLIDGGKTAVIEMADSSGLRLLKKEELNPLKTSSFGTGELIKFALDEGVSRIIIAMGGSATVDGGCGILSALGIDFLDKAGNNLQAVPTDLINMDKIDAAALDKRIFDCEIVILCDVDNKLLGAEGAASVFGPQKGASPADVQLLEAFLENFSKISAAQTGKNMAHIKHGGAAGGATAGLHTWLNAKLVNGIEYFLSLTNFDDALVHSDLLITGEGSIDRQTLQGKGPYGVALRAKNAKILVIGIAGKVPLEHDDELQQYFDVLISINNEPADMATALANTKENLIRTATAVGNIIALSK